MKALQADDTDQRAQEIADSKHNFRYLNTVRVWG